MIIQHKGSNGHERQNTAECRRRLLGEEPYEVPAEFNTSWAPVEPYFEYLLCMRQILLRIPQVQYA